MRLVFVERTAQHVLPSVELGARRDRRVSKAFGSLVEEPNKGRVAAKGSDEDGNRPRAAGCGLLLCCGAAVGEDGRVLNVNI